MKYIKDNPQSKNAKFYFIKSKGIYFTGICEKWKLENNLDFEEIKNPVLYGKIFLDGINTTYRDCKQMIFKDENGYEYVSSLNTSMDIILNLVKGELEDYFTLTKNGQVISLSLYRE